MTHIPASLIRLKPAVLVRNAFAVVLISLLTIEPIQAQEDLNVLEKNWVHFRDAPNSLYRHLSRSAFDLLEERKVEVSNIKSLDEWKNRQQYIKGQFEKVLGPFPDKTPLNVQTIRTLNKDFYVVEHMVYESQPGFFVTSSLYVPKGIKGKAPAIIYCSGHAEEGYRTEVYQHTILNLVKKGFVVLAIDPVGQGERLEYLDGKTGKSALGGPTKEHSYPGAQAFISGQSQALFMIWDGVRAVDFLLTRKEVDPDRIGITGRSGGGTQSAYIAALDERIKAAAPENYITNFTRLLETNGPQDAEQNFLHGIAEGLDHADLLAVRAPKPMLMVTTTRDIFSIQGARETALEVAGIYQAYGKEQNFRMVEDDAAHSTTLKNREALYAFFQEHLNNPGNPKDEEVQLLSIEENQVAPTGQVSTSFPGETVFSLNKKWTEKMVPTDRASIDLKSKVEEAKRLSGYIVPTERGEPVLTGRFKREGYHIEKYYIKGEGEYIVPYLLFVPEKPNQKSLLYLHPKGKSVEAAEGGELEWFVQQGFTVMSPDLVGIGEMGGQQIPGDSNFEGSSYNLWFASLQIGRSIVGVRAGDVVKLAHVLKDKLKMGEIYGLAKNEMTPVLLHAASFDPTISRIALIEPLASYRSIVMEQMYDPTYIQNTVPAALRAYDLPDLAASLAPRKLLLVNAHDATGKPISPTASEGEMGWIRKIYQSKGIPEELNILTIEIPDKYREHYGQWLK